MFDPVPEDVLKIIIDAGGQGGHGGPPPMHDMTPDVPTDKPSPKSAEELIQCIHDMTCEYLGISSDPNADKDDMSIMEDKGEEDGI